MAAARDDPPCIVGMACHLPGNIFSPEDLWQLIIEQKTAQGPVPAARYNIDGFYHPHKNRSGSTHVPGGYFLDEDPRLFDNSFFGINTIETTYLDPKQRKLLEVTFEALQSSGTTMADISGSSTGVYVANFLVDHQGAQTRDVDYLHRYLATGSGSTVMSNRISHVFNLVGPSLAIDTACSSSIYALHQALSAMEKGDCDSAIVASANLITAPETHIVVTKSGVLSPTGASHTFDVSADGYGRAEGASAIYVKRLSAALRDGNPIRAVIRGSAVNASGRTPGIVLPSGEMQAVVMRKAYENAGLDLNGTDYVECHGTGTPVGDVIEVNAVGRFFSQRQGPPLRIGSVKPNVGHSEATSGLTSIIKVTKALENSKMPPTYGVVNPSPKLNLEAANLKIATEVEEWPRALRRASINSFGYGGANAHVIIESADSYLEQEGCPLGSPNYEPTIGLDANGNGANRLEAIGHHGTTGGTETNGKINGENIDHGLSGTSDTEEDGEKVFVLPVSAASANALKPLAQAVSESASQCNDIYSLHNVAYTLSRRRDNLRYRTFLLASHDTASGKTTATIHDNTYSVMTDPLPFAFVFTGQGAQYSGMAKELLRLNGPFRDTIRALDKVLQELPTPYTPSWTLEQTLLDESELSSINEVTYSQPICTAIQIGLVDLLHTWGVQPRSVVGHSSGEIAAAYASDFLTASQAILVAYFRGYALGELGSKGAMLAAGMSPASAQSLIDSKQLQGQVRVACTNAPESVTLSGYVNAIDTLEAELQREKKFTRRLQTGGRAYHSHMMEQIGQLYEDLLRPIFDPQNSTLKAPGEKSFVARNMYSSVGSSPEDLEIVTPSHMGAAYWRHNLEQPVQFNAAMSSLIGDVSKCHLVEIGPHSALKGPIEQIRKAMNLDTKSLLYSPTLVRKEDANLCMKTLAGTLFAQGHALAWEHVNSQRQTENKPLQLKALHQLPRYPWDYSGPLLWSEPRVNVELRNREHVRHELLGSAALTGNGIDFSWRNILRPSEMPWLKDYKLENKVVFPVAGYVAIAIEAASQASGIKAQLQERQPGAFGFELRDVKVITALNVLDEDDAAGKDLELHTTLSRRKISGARTSDNWYDFSISSLFWMSRQATLHCSGSIRVVPGGKNGGESLGIKVEQAEGFDLWSSTNRWYTKWHKEGLCFGPQFKSLSSLRTDSARQRHEVIATTRIEPALVDSPYEFYPVHPITIDAGLQAACLSGSSGHVSSLKAWLPVSISHCYIQPSAHPDMEAEGEIHVKSEEMGFSSRRIAGTIWDASGVVIVDFRDSWISLYNGKKTDNADLSNPLDIYMQRHPALRVQWKLDVSRLDPDADESLQRYIASFVKQQHPEIRQDASLAAIGALLDLAGHKNPRMRVLELEGDAQGYKASKWLSMLDKETAFPRCRSWHRGTLGDTGEVSLQDDVEGPFDVVLIPKKATLTSTTTGVEGLISSLIGERGIVIARKSDTVVHGLRKAGFDVMDAGGDQVIFATRPLPLTSLHGRRAVILHADNCSDIINNFSTALATHLEREAGIDKAGIVPLSQVNTIHINEKDICISLVEIEEELLATMSPQAMDSLRAVTNTVTDLVWLTGANMLGSEPNPNLTLSSGLSRALMLEQPTLRWSVMDIGSAQDQLADAAKAKGVCGNVVRALVNEYEKDDCEFISVDGLVHISRYGPDWGVNSLFGQRLEPPAVKTKKGVLGEINQARLSISRPGSTDTMYFQQLCEPGDQVSPPGGYVDIKVKAVSLSAKDVYAMYGRVETRGKTTGCDFSGVVTAIGPEVGTGNAERPETLRVGDSVVACAPFHVGTMARVPVGCAHRLRENEDPTVLTTLPLIYATALYALNDRARLQAGESVLTNAGSGIGIAATALALNAGAVVYTTCDSEAKREYLIKELGLHPWHIFSSRDGSFVQDVLKATGHRGVDVVINSLVGDLMEADWQDCLADFGRFVEIGKREMLDVGRLDMSAFMRNATFTAFDLPDLFHSRDPSQRAVWDRLIVETLGLYRAGKIRPPPITVFDVTQLSEAYQYFANKDRVSKVVISMQNPLARVPIAPAPYLTLFDPDKTYLLIGCLGGLGRSLSRWMMTRGARDFVFLGRSGADKPSAQHLVSSLEQAGATVGVVRGDVSNAADVEDAVAACLFTGRQIGGVVQAAMGLHEALFASMSNEAWHTSIGPKFQGTWNIHNALQGVDLDFFLLTSSISGTVASATQSNYCSANGFLDAFARWRRSQGQPCVSVGLGMISEVGYMHENPEIGALLLRKGVQPLNEDEFLQVIDLALASEASGQVAEAHMLTGLEQASMRELSTRGFDVSTFGAVSEARASILRASFHAEKEAAEAKASSRSMTAEDAAKAAAPWFKDVPVALAAGFAPEASAETMREAILRLMKKRFSNLILVPFDQVDENKALPELGLDSMVAAEFRSWFWAFFRVDLRFPDIMSGESKLVTLAEFVEDKIMQSVAN